MIPLLASLLIVLKVCHGHIGQPNIVFIVADDLGYNDVSWHNPEMITPNLHRMATKGIILEQAYVQPICTPTRAALLTGRYPIHTGRQHNVLHPKQPRGLFTNFTLLPQYLKKIGYETHLVGKWHLGFCNTIYLPTRRGFDSFYGYYNGAEDYYTHYRGKGYDFRDGEKVDRSATGHYSSHLFARRAVKIIKEQENNTKPMFLYMAFQSVHAPLEVPKKYMKHYKHIKNKARRTYSGMVTALDEAVGDITKALKKAGKIQNTLIVFTADNGGQTLYGGNNFPLRGNKHTLWEGGTRAAAFIYGPMLKRTGRVHHGLIHVTDWLPTLLTAAGGNTKDLGNIDGINQWDSLSRNKTSPRKEMLYNIDPFGLLDDSINKPGATGAAIRIGPYKLIKGNPGKPDGWIPPPGVIDLNDEQYLSHIGKLFSNENECKNFNRNNMANASDILLFNLDKDPYENNDLSSAYPALVNILLEHLDQYQASMIPPDFTEEIPDGNPDKWGGVWSPGWCQARPF